MVALPPAFYSFIFFQERSAETNAARLRSVDRLISGKGTLDGHGMVEMREEELAAKSLAVEHEAEEYLPVDAAEEDLDMAESPPPVKNNTKHIYYCLKFFQYYVCI